MLIVLNVAYVDMAWCCQVVRTYGFGDHDCIFDTAVLSDGSIVATGYTIRPGHTDKDLLLIRTTPDCGAIEWARAFGASSDEWGRSIIETHTGRLIVTGFTESIGNADRSLMLSRFSSATGGHVWTTVLTAMPGQGFDLDGYCVIEDEDYPYQLVVTGDLYRPSTQRYSLILAKFDAGGGFDRIRSVYAALTHVRGKAVIEMCGHFNNDYMVAGCMENSNIGERILLAKFSSLGGFNWGWWIDDNDNVNIDPQCSYALTRTHDCGMSLTGVTGDDLFALRRDDAGDYVWGNILTSGTIEGRAVMEAANHDIIVTGGNQGPSGGVDLSRWERDGDPIWHKLIGGPGWDKGFALLEDVGGDLWVHGGTNSWGAGGRDALAVRYDPDGSTCVPDASMDDNYEWAPEEGQAILLSAIPPVTDPSWHPPDYDLDLEKEIVCFAGEPCDIDTPLQQRATLQLHPSAPNPVGVGTRITYTVPAVEKPVPVDLRILDVSGRLIRNLVDDVQNEGRYEVVWDATDEQGKVVPRGVYYLELHCKGERQGRRLVLVR
jgi:hypothetical protein